jgi:hypothetical protein
VCRLGHSQRKIVLVRAYATLPGTQSEKDSVPVPTWCSIYTPEHNSPCGTIVRVTSSFTHVSAFPAFLLLTGHEAALVPFLYKSYCSYHLLTALPQPRCLLFILPHVI